MAIQRRWKLLACAIMLVGIMAVSECSAQEGIR
jgi:hypothetical protein